MPLVLQQKGRDERSGMLRHAPEKCHRQSSGGWLNFRRPTPCSLVQSDTDTEPLDTNRHCSPRFFPYVGRPGLDASPGYKTSLHPSYLADSLCLLTHPPPGVLPKSDRPIKAFINRPQRWLFLPAEFSNSSNKMWSTGKGNGKPLQYSCLENPMNSMKRQKHRTLKDELPRSKMPNMLLEISGEITPEIMKRRSQSKNNTQLWMGLVIEARSDAVNSNIAQESGMLGP